MNEKALDVLRQYELNIYRVNRGRGGMVVNTNDGIKLLLECTRQDKYYEREDYITKAVCECGFESVDTYTRNAEGRLVSVDEDGRRYIVKKWFDGSECNVKDLNDICLAVRTLAKMHKTLDIVSYNEKQKQKLFSQQLQVRAAEVEGVKLENVKLECVKSECKEAEYTEIKVTEEGDETPVSLFSLFNGKENSVQMRDVYTRHMRELKLAGNYLRNKKKKSQFEQLAYSNIGSFYREAQKAVAKLNDKRFDSRFKEAADNLELCHGSFNYHNVIVMEEGAAVTNFDKCKNECQIYDLYQFMRKILEKYDWDIETAYKMLSEYDKVKNISDKDVELIAAMFAFPEKFWKIINYYFNSNKAWIPPKSIEKLSKAINQNPARLEFLETLS